jgi:short subunit dehydrogenase-like uncharacterized protein
MTPVGVAMRSSALRRAAGALISRLPEGPSPEQRERMRWMIVCEAKRGEIERKGVISGNDVYGFTAAAITTGAMIAAGRGFKVRGGLTPSQAFDPESFLGELERFDVRWQVHDSRAPAPVGA